MDKFRDFDQFFAETEDKSEVSIKLFERKYTLPTKIPAKIMLETYKLSKQGIDEVSEAKQMEMAIAVLGESNVEEWCDKGLSLEQLIDIMKWAVEQISNKTESSSSKK